MKFIIILYLIFIIPHVFSNPKENNDLHWTQKIFLKEKKLDKNIEVTTKKDLVNKKINELEDQSKNSNVKLEGARIVGYQTSLLVLLIDNNYFQKAKEWTERLSKFLKKEINLRMKLDISYYSLDFRHIG